MSAAEKENSLATKSSTHWASAKASRSALSPLQAGTSGSPALSQGPAIIANGRGENPRSSAVSPADVEDIFAAAEAELQVSYTLSSSCHQQRRALWNVQLQMQHAWEGKQMRWSHGAEEPSCHVPIVLKLVPCLQDLYETAGRFATMSPEEILSRKHELHPRYGSTQLTLS